MHPLLNELKALAARGNELASAGVQVENNLASEEDVKAEYKAFKGYLAQRMKDYERSEAKQDALGVSSAFMSGLRNAHIALRSPTYTSPKNSGWRTSVHDACSELAYYIDRVEKNLGARLPPI
jgi:hypothetical protein